MYVCILVLYTSFCIYVTLGLKRERGAPSSFLYVFYRSKWGGRFRRKFCFGTTPKNPSVLHPRGPKCVNSQGFALRKFCSHWA